MITTLLFTCDEEKSKESLVLVGVFSNREQRNSAIKHLLNEGQIVFNKGWEFNEKDTAYDLNNCYKYLRAYEIEGGNEFNNGMFLLDF
ncbi:MAG: hypothetical protein ACOCQR_02135 [bacterium]